MSSFLSQMSVPRLNIVPNRIQLRRASHTYGADQPFESLSEAHVVDAPSLKSSQRNQPLPEKSRAALGAILAASAFVCLVALAGVFHVRSLAVHIHNTRTTKRSEQYCPCCTDLTREHLIMLIVARAAGAPTLAWKRGTERAARRKI